MAKSLRASSKVKARGVKRVKVFDPIYEARARRLAEKLHGSRFGGSKDEDDKMEVEDIKGDDAKEEGVDSTSDKKSISTSGWRTSRHAHWKQKKASKVSDRKRKGSRVLAFSRKKK